MTIKTTAKILEKNENTATIKIEFGTIIEAEYEKVENTNLYYVFTEAENYFFFEYFDGYGTEFTKLCKFDDTIENFDGWNTIYDTLEELKKQFEEYQTENDEVKSAPDTSKFIATKRGDVQVLRDYVKRNNYYTRYYAPVFTIGTAMYHNVPEYLMTRLLNVYRFAIELGFSFGRSKCKFGKICGTAWIGFGLI